jgi:hypothetical protein
MPPVIPPFNPVTSLFPNLTNPPVYPYGYGNPYPLVQPSSWPMNKNPNPTNPVVRPNPNTSISTFPNSLFYRG